MRYFRILDINFVDGLYSKIFDKIKLGGFMVVPSGPGLSSIGKDLQYTEAVKNADFAIPDSGFLVFLLRWLKGIKIKKLSGFKFLNKFFKESFQKNELFLIDPNIEESKLNNDYLNEKGIPIQKSYQYVAPMYSDKKIEDKALLETLNDLKEKPIYVMINLGSGVQEPLGYYLKQNLKFSTSIICTGAAISFLTGSQAKISPFIDKLGLGWFWRCIKTPKIFIPRYLKAFSLFFLILKSNVEELNNP